ncbi:hypothetical protein AB0F11_02020 [Streptomyces sp. NPDC032472]|uniref:hypothetical protein n=1 Tax=Streptomyces sp. NPDC032472 TaxID=3155018 RepID=UPI0033EA81E1
MFRLVRGTGHILDVLDVLHRDQVALRIHDGAFSAMDLTARHPRTGELLSTVKFMVQTLAAAGELQRELTYDGLRAAEAKGNKGGRRPAVPADKTDAVRTAYLEAAPSPLSPAITASAAAPSAPPSPISCPNTRPPAQAPRPRSCRSSSTCPARSPTSSGPPTWNLSSASRSTKGWPYDAARATPCASAPPPRSTASSSSACQSLDGTPGAPAIPAQRKARREYENRVAALASNTL